MDGPYPSKTGKDRIVEAARALFSTKGFHQTAMSELANDSHVSVGQVYRFFSGKNDIISAIVEEDSVSRLAAMDDIASDLETGAIPLQIALERMFLRSLSSGDEALSFEILAEAHRNEAVAQTIIGLCDRYRVTLGRIACHANPGLSAEALQAAEEVLLACMFGLAHRKLSNPRLSREKTAVRAARMMISALALDESA